MAQLNGTPQMAQLNGTPQMAHLRTVKKINEYFKIRQKYSKYPSKYSGDICPAVGYSDVISVRYCFFLFFCFMVSNSFST